MVGLSEALASLRDMLADSRKVYHAALKQTAEPGRAVLFRDMIVLRTKRIDGNERPLATMSIPFDRSGTPKPTAHRTMIDIRSRLKGLDAHASPAFASGEDNKLKRCDQVLVGAEIDSVVIALLRQQREVIGVKIDAKRQQAWEA